MKKTRLGYLRLCDAAPLIVARGLGCYAQAGLRVELVPLKSWAEVRDRLMLGDIHAAHCLAGIPLAAQAGLFGPEAKLATAFTLSHSGNAITLATPLAQLFRTGRDAFAALARERSAQGRPLTFASVFPVSKHEYELRHWWAGLGLAPEDMRLVVVSPAETAPSLHSGRIDGYCVGEPWNTRAIVEGWGEAVTTSAQLGLPGTEKVLAVDAGWLKAPEHAALLQALTLAADWLADAANAESAMELLAPYAGRPLRELRAAICGEFRTQRNAVPAAAEPFLRFDRGINRPNTAHGLWYLQQMRAADQLDPAVRMEEVCARAFRADVYDELIGAR
ncbi:MAG TPA: CmpA/NrtA family ABC transporter substrate-binding protein [Nevskiaceae bacterium]|nr:CmpA/NrtA family ABC transporter substrate-binding protein [Nevskiaceae bacterium]